MAVDVAPPVYRRSAKNPRRSTGGQKRRVSGVSMAVAVILCLLILPILAVMIITALRPEGTMPFAAGGYTFENFGDILSDSFTWRLFLNTLVYAISSLVVALILTVPVVWLVERTDLPGKRMIRALIFVPLVIPGALAAMGWIQLLARRTGFINVWWRGIVGQETGPSAQGPLNSYSFTVLVLVTAFAIMPSMFIMLSASFRNMDNNLEEAGRTSGASNFSVARTVTMPLMMPSVATAGIYFFILLIEFFEIPLVIGLNADYRVLSTYIFLLVRNDATGPQYSRAATFGVLVVVIGIIFSLIYSRLARFAYKYAVIRGQRQAPRLLRLGHKRRWVAFAIVMVFFFVSQVLPILALAWTSLFKRYPQPSFAALKNISLESYQAVLKDPRWGDAIYNTLVLMVSAAVVTVVLGTLAGWAVIRGKGGWTRILDVLAFMPRAIPTVIIAVGVFLLLIRTPLYGTIWIIVVGHVIAYMPYVVRTMTSTLIQIHQELEESSRASGASQLRTIVSIIFPILRPSMVDSLLWVAAHGIRDFTFALLLCTTTNTVVSQLLWQSWSNAHVEQTAAMAMMLILALVAVVVPLQMWVNKKSNL